MITLHRKDTVPNKVNSRKLKWVLNNDGRKIDFVSYTRILRLCHECGNTTIHNYYYWDYFNRQNGCRPICLDCESDQKWPNAPNPRVVETHPDKTVTVKITKPIINYIFDLFFKKSVVVCAGCEITEKIYNCDECEKNKHVFWTTWLWCYRKYAVQDVRNFIYRLYLTTTTNTNMRRPQNNIVKK